MENTLLPGDRILAQSFPLYPPIRGQLIIFLSPAEKDLIIVKRVIAIPGDHVRIARDEVILNGAKLDEKYVARKSGGADAAGFYPENFPNDVSLPGCAEGHEMLSQHVVNGEIVVPPGQYFVLGDWRENSLDSRCWGFVSFDSLVAKPFLIFDSIDEPVGEPSEPSLDWLGKRRWNRLFKFL